MISWLKRTAKRMLNELLLRHTIHKTSVEVTALNNKIDVLLSAGNARDAGLREIRAELDMLSREMGEQHEALADRFLESTIETRKAFDALGHEMRGQHEALFGLINAVNRQQEELAQQHTALAERILENAGETSQALERLAETVAQQHTVLAGRIMESAGETSQALEAAIIKSGESFQARMATFVRKIEGLERLSFHQHEALASHAGESLQALERLAETLARQHAVLAGRIMESADETSQALEAAIIKSGASFQSRMATFVRKIEELERLSFRQHEALTALSRVLDTQHPLPATRGWAASPDLLLHLYELIVEKRPAIVVELGSGVSSLVIAAALQANGRGRLFSFDHDAEYSAATTARLEREGLADVAVVEHAPLSQWLPPTPTSLGGSWNWYTLPQSTRALPVIDLLIVDGPPEKTGSYARYPALPALAHKLAADAIVLLDDTIREAETKIAEAWRDELGFDLTLRPDFEKGLAVLTRKPDEASEEQEH